MGSRTCLRRRNSCLFGTDNLKHMIEWHKKYLAWWKKKLNISDYGILWVAFIKGIFIGLLIYYFFIN